MDADPVATGRAYTLPDFVPDFLATGRNVASEVLDNSSEEVSASTDPSAKSIDGVAGDYK